MNLTRLSLERVPFGRSPQRPPTNTERVQAYRSQLPVVFGNAWRLPPSRFTEKRA